MKLNYDSLSPHERSLKYLVDSMREVPYINHSGLEKSTTVRFNDQIYPKVKAIANISGNSLNTVINELAQVALGIVISNMTEEEVQALNDESLLVHQEWVSEVNKGA